MKVPYLYLRQSILLHWSQHSDHTITTDTDDEGIVLKEFHVLLAALDIRMFTDYEIKVVFNSMDINGRCVLLTLHMRIEAYRCSITVCLNVCG